MEDKINTIPSIEYLTFVSVLGEENAELARRVVDAGFTSNILEGWDKKKAVTVFRIIDKLGRLD
jgi:hypothetical protein